MPGNLENTEVPIRLEKFSFQSNPKERQCQRMFRLPHNCTHLTGKVMLKVLQIRLLQYVNHELQMFKLVLEKAEEPEIKLPTSTGSLKKQENSRKMSTSVLLTMPKPLTVWTTTNWKILQAIGIPDH